MRAVLVGLLVLVLISLVTPNATAPPSPSTLSVSIGPGVVAVKVNLSIQQNLTAFNNVFSFPQFHSLLEGVNASTATLALQSAISSKSSLAQVRDVTLEGRTSSWSNTTGLQWFNITLSFGVTGISNTTNGASREDLSWKSFAVSSDIGLGGFEVNSLGAKWLQGTAQTLSQEPTSRILAYFYEVNSDPVNARLFAGVVAGIHALNFSRLATPLSQWQRTYEPLAPTTSWTLAVSPVLGLTFGRAIQEESGAPLTTLFGLFYTLQASVSAPADSRVQGDILSSSVSGLPETLMGLTIISSAVVGSVAFIYERRLLTTQVRRKSRR